MRWSLGEKPGGAAVGLEARRLSRLLWARNLLDYNRGMKRKTLYETNPHLRDPAEATRQIIRSVASSTAIETGQPVREIEERIKHLRSLPPRVMLA